MQFARVVFPEQRSAGVVAGPPDRTLLRADGPPVEMVYARRDAHRSTLPTARPAVDALLSNPLGDPAVPMKCLLSETVKTEFNRHVALTDDRLSRPITDADRRAIRESAARVARLVSLQHSRTALASTLLRDTDDERYLADKGARAGLTGFASAAWDDAA